VSVRWTLSLQHSPSEVCLSDDGLDDSHVDSSFHIGADGARMESTVVDIDSARKATRNLRKLWRKFTPPVHIILPAWDAHRWTTEFVNSVDRGELAGRTVFPSLNDGQKQALADWLVGMGPLVTTGDMYALQYFMLVLTALHGPGGICLHEAWSMMRHLPSSPTPSARSHITDLVRENNIVLIGGPAGNPIAKDLLDDLHAQSLFPDAPTSDFRIRKWGHPLSAQESFLSPSIGKNCDDEDCGLLLVGRNPWAKDKEKWFMAAMGSASWGTQASAALACSEAGAGELIRSKVSPDPEIGAASWLGEIGYVKVWPKLAQEPRRRDRLPDLTVPDSEFQMVFPEPGDRHTNPASILRAGEMLRLAQRGPNLEVHVRAAVLVLAIFCLCLSVGFGVFGVLSRQPWGPIAAAFSSALAGVGLLRHSFGVRGSDPELGGPPMHQRSMSG
jgi:hypothetical protein